MDGNTRIIKWAGRVSFLGWCIVIFFGWRGVSFVPVRGVSFLAQTPLLINTPPPHTFDDDTNALILDVFARGQQFGNQGHVFSKVGDSITASLHFLYPIGYGFYTLDESTTYLEPLIAYYRAGAAQGTNPFMHRSLAAHVGWAAWGALDPTLTNEIACGADSPLICEYRLTRPSIALIMYGTNDIGYRTPYQFRADMTTIVQLSISMGVIPIISTLPPQPQVHAQVKQFNDVLREISDTYHVPLWDYHAAMVNLPNWGLAWDNLHPSYPPHESISSADFTGDNLRYGYNVRNLGALEMLYSVQWVITGGI
jgi:hypothetical protein